jgi:hypothetical protein
MADHRITVRGYSGEVDIECSCQLYGETLNAPAELDEINRLADEHIEAAERVKE